MVNRMKMLNYIKINTNNLIDNIKYVKNNYDFCYYGFNVSNNAFFHGMYLINYLEGLVDYLYVNNFNDLLMIRKYNKDIPVIYNGVINEDNVYDLIINNAIVVIHSGQLLQEIRSLKLKDTLSFVFYVDPKGLVGINDKQDILDFLREDNKYFNLLGVMANPKEKEDDDFKYIIRPINNCKLMILGNEDDKNKKFGANMIVFDYAAYGVNKKKKKLFQKNDNSFKQVFGMYSRIIKIKKENHNKKVKYIAVIPLGYYHGMSDNIKQVYIKDKLYPVMKVDKEFTYLEVDENIKENMEVEVSSSNNPLENYFDNHPFYYFSLFNSNIPIIFDDYILEKTLIY